MFQQFNSKLIETVIDESGENILQVTVPEIADLLCNRIKSFECCEVRSKKDYAGLPKRWILRRLNSNAPLPNPDPQDKKLKRRQSSSSEELEEMEL